MMNQFEAKQMKEVREIISIVELVSLLFGGIIVFKYCFNEEKINIIESYFNIISVGVVISILASIYFLWLYFSKKNNMVVKFTKNELVRDYIILIIFSTLLMLSGNEKSPYKFLFLFVIITATLKFGMKHGMTIAIVSSIIILAIDLFYASNVRVNQHFEDDLILAGVFILTAWPLGHYVKVEGEHKRELSKLANVDGLTGVYNHRYFHEILKKTICEAEKLDFPVSMMLIDIDYFKNYNDLYGHQKGDEVLRNIGRILKQCEKDGAIAARYGGEEFAVIMPHKSEEDAIKIAECIRMQVEKFKFDGEENQPRGNLTVSIGISIFPIKAKNDTELINSADDALYRAKFFNKNRVESYYSILEELKNDIEEEHIDLITSIKTLISVINAKDRYTYGHSERVVMYSRLLGQKLGIDECDQKTLKFGAYMHDIGKINISKDILNKKMPLTNEEWKILKQHPVNGVEIIKSVKTLNKIMPLILYHHERYDGTGYPSKLRGEDIPYLARILTVVDSFDAMTSNRPYNKRKTYEEAIEELRRCESTQFDPDIAEAFISVIEENKDKLDNLIICEKN